MRGRVITVLFSSILFLSPAFPQCTYQLQASWQFRASYLDLAIDGSDLWGATGYGVHLFDRSVDPPRFLAAVAVPGLTRVIRARDGVAYAGSGSSVHVIRRAGTRLDIARSLDLGASINDLLLHNATLVVATASGIVPIDIARPLEPAILPTQLPGRSIQSLARSEAALFAGDGDTSVEVLSLSASAVLPPIISLSRGISVKVIGSRLYVSDGQQTDAFTLTGVTAVRLGTIPFGTTSLAAGGANVIFAAGNDRRLRALDISAIEAPIDLFTVDVPVTLGTINRVGAMQTAGSRLYIGGGDSGLLVYDLSSFLAPYPVRNYFVGMKTSVTTSATAVYVANATGGLTEMTRSTGSLTLGRAWGAGTQYVVHDTANDFLLTSSDRTLTFWTVRATTPTVVSTATLSATIKSAVLSGAKAYALLTDGTLWSADFAQTSPEPVRIGTGSYSFLDRSGASIATAEVTNDATTIIRLYSTGSLDTTPATATVNGAAITFAIGPSSAALFTFRGITVVDFIATTPIERLLPHSATANVTDLTIAAGKLLDVTSSAVRVWNLTSFALERQFALAQPALIASAPDVRFAAVTTADGVASILYESTSQQPTLAASIGGNKFPRKAVAGGNRLYLFDGTSVDAFETAAASSLRFLTSIPVLGVIDVAASDTALFTLSNTGTVTMYSKDGSVRTGTLGEGTDVVPSTIFSVRGSPWVSFSKGCVTTGCEDKTSVFDPQTLGVTASLPGNVIDVVTSGANSAAVFELPNEIRYYNVTDPLHPSQTASRPVEGAAASIAIAGSTVFTIGDKLYSYSAPSLLKTGEQWSPQTPTAATQLAIDGACAVVTGRSANAEVYTWSPGTWTASGALTLPAGVRSIVIDHDRFVLLTDYSLDIWSRGPAPPPRRRRAIR
jgi:hypothetical protein